MHSEYTSADKIYKYEISFTFPYVGKIFVNVQLNRQQSKFLQETQYKDFNICDIHNTCDISISVALSCHP